MIFLKTKRATTPLTQSHQNTNVDGFDDADNKLMACVRQHRTIYDKSCSSYRVPKQTDLAWKKIAAETGMSIAEARQRYRSIRVKVGRYMNKQKSGHYGVNSADQGQRFAHWEWLFAHIMPKRTSSFNTRNEAATAYLSDSFLS